MWWLRVVPVLVLGVVLVGYVAMRPTLAETVPHLAIAEYPAGLLVTGLLVYVALRRPRRERETPAPAWRRHAQVVRALPDAELDRLQAPLRAWVERGDDPRAAAGVIARAQARDASEAQALEADLAERLASARSPRAREKLLNDLAKSTPKTGTGA